MSNEIGQTPKQAQMSGFLQEFRRIERDRAGLQQLDAALSKCTLLSPEERKAIRRVSASELRLSLGSDQHH